MKLYTKLCLSIIPSRLKSHLINEGKMRQKEAVGSKFQFLQKSYSQEGEDMILSRYFRDRKDGFYVDVGAHHPKRFSNTYHFYLRGWKGINVDAMPGSMDEFIHERERDINLEVPISDREEELTYYMFNEPALNTFDETLAEQKNGYRDFKIVDTKKLTSRTLRSILDEYLPAKQFIDFFSVDVEGLDYEVLQSNDWEKYRPEIIVVEELYNLVEDVPNGRIYKFLKEKNYSFLAKTINSLFFVDNKKK